MGGDYLFILTPHKGVNSEVGVEAGGGGEGERRVGGRVHADRRVLMEVAKGRRGTGGGGRGGGGGGGGAGGGEKTPFFPQEKTGDHGGGHSKKG